MVTDAATSFTLHESRLKIIFRSVERDSESSSDVTKLRLRFFKFFEKVFSKNLKKWRDFFKEFQKIANFHKKSAISQRGGLGGRIEAGLEGGWPGRRERG